MNQHKNRQRGKKSAIDVPEQKQASKPEHKPERLQKIMAGAGLGSRRMLEKQIKKGDVLINNKAAANQVFQKLLIY